jgi:K+ transporter
MLAVAAVRAAVLLPVTIVTAVISIVSPIVGSALFLGITAYLSVFSQMETLRGVPNISNDKKTYAMVIATIIFSAIVALLILYMATKCLNINATVGDLLDQIF